MTKNAFILNFFKLYNMLWTLALPFLKTNRRLKKGFIKRTTCYHHSKADIWIQAASAGEAYLAVSILKQLSPPRPLKVLVTATTSQGIDILKTRLDQKVLCDTIDLRIEWFPFDGPRIVKEAVGIINPNIMVLLETEIWPALLYYLKQNRTRIFIVNARLSTKSFSRYMKTKFLWQHLAPDRILATSLQDARRYKQVFETTLVNTMPNIKFDAMDSEIPDPSMVQYLQKILPKTLPLTILASIRKQEEKDMMLLLSYILKKFPDQVVAIFPRHMHRIQAWKKHLASHGFKFITRSGVTAPLTTPGIVLWDTFGELNTAYGFASVVFIGGSLKPLGGQNFIEPAIKGAVTVTGPYYDDFAWATDDIFDTKIVLKKDTWQVVANTILKALQSPSDRSDRVLEAQDFIRTKKGGTRQACHEILKSFDGFI